MIDDDECIKTWVVTMTVHAAPDVAPAKIEEDLRRWTSHIYDTIKIEPLIEDS